MKRTNLTSGLVFVSLFYFLLKGDDNYYLPLPRCGELSHTESLEQRVAQSSPPFASPLIN